MADAGQSFVRNLGRGWKINPALPIKGGSVRAIFQTNGWFGPGLHLGAKIALIEDRQ
jgi:hypothetical protein